MTTKVYTFARLPREIQKWAGGKGGTLAQLYQARYPVPAGFIILPGSFDKDRLNPDVWEEVKQHLSDLRRDDPSASFAVRSSGLSEDSAQASFAGEFETILDVNTDNAIWDAIHTVYHSRHAARVQAYSQAQGIEEEHEIAVVVQRMIPSDISGVLFTADPVTGSQRAMTGNAIHGLGESLVSGEANAESFTLKHPSGIYEGPPELKHIAQKLYKVARRLEDEMKAPQDIEWATAKGKLYLLQARPITTLREHSPITGTWNTSLTGDYLWTNANLSEALPDVMTPFTWSVWKRFHEETRFIPGAAPTVGNIGGRCYGNLSLFISFYVALGKDVQSALKEGVDTMGQVPEGITIPLIPLPKGFILTLIPEILSRRMKIGKFMREAPVFIKETPSWCRETRQEIGEAKTAAALISLWHDTLAPYYAQACWMLRFITKRSISLTGDLSRELTKKVGKADANELLSNQGGSGNLASMGPMVGLAKVARGQMSRETYLERYGHRGPHEGELSIPAPAENPEWLDQQLATFARSPFDVETMLRAQRTDFEAAWQRFELRYPREAKRIRRRIERAGEAARLREAVRSEFTRVGRIFRTFALHSGKLTGLGEDVFFLTIDELLEVLSGDKTVVAYLPARRKTHEDYCALPPYPAIISGRFDPFLWAADPNRRSDYFDAHAPAPVPESGIITGFAGAAGRVEGLVRRLDAVEAGEQLQTGEILVTTMTNVGWTPLFPRAAAIVTDVGAPLSHAAIVARELGIPAVVGCGNATMRLRTGDRVRVDGANGIVEILHQAGKKFEPSQKP